LTVAAFMDLALYHPEFGYYASQHQRSGRAGDFYTSVDVGSIFGELLAVQFARMATVLPGEFSLVEAAAGNGRLMRDVLDALGRETPELYARTRVHLVERSPEARAAQPEVLQEHRDTIASTSADLPDSFAGVLFANELLDALPVHVLVMREDGPREVFVDVEGDALVEREAPPARQELVRELELGPPLTPGMRVEVNLSARQWIAEAARRLDHGFLLLIDYGDTAEALRAPFRREGTLRAFRGHHVSGRWIESPGEQDLTSHVDFTALGRWARDSGLKALGRTDQTRFLIALGAMERLERDQERLPPAEALRRRLAMKTLIVPGGMGSTHWAAVWQKGEWGQTPVLRFP
jgi:SAM-dependent MidA family methyltransferase